ncbi:protein retinal degeneration B-like isoform X2 [Dendronephthya gigantea]|uniref:protein retinal degeneration B-like isoform X2 n=1 Tax=Dendronephthya gigantea TaxID=151771 RepID=UPI00106D4186|nr:protein retinal degeneration B-like isoform X2 [Dendronephthya gigantea]
MLIKEYRIPLPMSVEEYRIAQLYMIQKKSRLESTGEGSGVEIIENRPYSNGPGGDGQYTKKIYHIGNHIPGWLKAIVPKSALQVIEEAWNAYPYTKMKTTCPFVEKFYVDVETKYLPDGGSTENVFNLSAAQLSNQTVDLIDPVKDPIPSSQYSEEEDPLLYVSKKTGRGPLAADWLNQSHKSIMCAYKKITVEFRYWGMQGKIEQFIHDGLRKPMLMGHRQAWVWQDEWVGLTIADIRELEKETQRMLANKMGNASDPNVGNIITQDDDDGNDTLKRQPPMRQRGSTIELLSQESVDVHAADHDDVIHSEIRWRIGSFNSSDTDDEFFDAEDTFNSDSSGGSMESLDSDNPQDTRESRFKKPPVHKTVSGSSTSSSSTCRTTILMLIVHGGNPLEPTSDIKSKENDCERLKREFQNVMQNHYKEGLGRIAFRLVECPHVYKDVLPALKDIIPQMTDEREGDQCQPSFNFPVSSLSILAACSSGYSEMIDATITRANTVYREFLNSDAGAGFIGEVCIVGDCVGALLAYEAMCQEQWSIGSFETNPSNPASPISKQDRHFDNKLRIHDKSLRLSCSDMDLRDAPDMDFPKRAYSVGNKNSSSLEDGLDSNSETYAVSVPFKVRKLEFDVSRFFAFGSPIGLVLLHKRLSAFSSTGTGAPAKPACSQVYNLFHPFEPLSARIEPLILPQLSQIPSVNVPRYQKFPRGDGVSNDVMAMIGGRPELFREKPKIGEKVKVSRTCSNISTCSTLSTDALDFSVSDSVREGVQRWWGSERIDYSLYSPKNLQQLPLSVLCPLSHISYWDSKDVVAFMVRQIFDINGTPVQSPRSNQLERRLSNFHIANPREKWLKKRTAYKIKNLAPNHRANDAIALEGSAQIVTARFTYGPLDVAALTGEKVDIYLMSFPPAGEWTLIDTVTTGSGGRASFTLPEESKLGVGIYPAKMVARGDHTTVDCNLAVLPAKTEAVVFSIDGAFSASVSLRGRHPKVQPGAVDVVRYWQEHGYLIIYVTSRPDFQKNQVMLWMSEHNFPFGLVSFCGSLSTVDIQRHKAEYLKNLTTNMKVVIHAAYGSSKDVAVYSGLGVGPNAIFVIGGKSKRNEKLATYLRDGYSTHLASLTNDPISKAATGNSRISLRRGCFGLPKKHKHSSKRYSNTYR